MIALLVGLAAAVALYVSGLWLMARTQAASIAGLPSAWRNHPDLRSRYDAAIRRSFRSVLGSPSRSNVGWFLEFVVGFVALGVSRFSLGYDVLLVVVLALVFASGGMNRAAAEARRIAEREQLPPLPTRPVRRNLLYGSRVMYWAGLLGSGCFVGGLIAFPLR